MAAPSAKHNPACRALYARVQTPHPDKPAIAIGHVMRKRLRLAFVVWKTDRPFDPTHYPWEGPDASTWVGESMDEAQAPSHTPDEPAGSGATAICAVTGADAGPAVKSAGVWLDFIHLKRQLSMVRVLDHLGLAPRLKKSLRPGPRHARWDRRDGQPRTEGAWD